jgi:predicted nucleic acid-binding protein
VSIHACPPRSGLPEALAAVPEFLRCRVRGQSPPGRKPLPRPLAGWIAACCLAHQFPLATFNAKDFEDFAEHDGLRLIST